MQRKPFRPQPQGGKARRSGAPRALLGRVFLALSLGIVFALLLSLLWRQNAQPPLQTGEPSSRQRLLKEVPKTALPEPRVLPLGSPSENQGTEKGGEQPAPEGRFSSGLPSDTAGGPTEAQREGGAAGTSATEGLTNKPDSEEIPAPLKPSQQSVQPPGKAVQAEPGTPSSDRTNGSKADMAREPGGSPTMTPTPDTPVYVVQVGAFSRKENAERISRRLKEHGFQVNVSPFQHKSLGRLYLVRLDPLPSEEQARKAADKIAALEKTKPMVIKIDKAP